MGIERLWGIGIFDPKLAVIQSCSRPVLVLFAPGGLHHDFAGMGVVSELITCYSRKPIFGLPFRRICERGHCYTGLSGLGATTCFTSGQSIYAGLGVFLPQLHGCRAVNHQSV